MVDQIPFGGNEFADNPESRCPCLLLLDVSGSMSGSPINELNSGLQVFKDALAADSLASKRVEIGIITFGGHVKIVQEFETVNFYQPSTMQASGDTPMGSAIIKGLEMLRQRKDTYRANGISYYRPWVFMITDGAPTDSWQEASTMIKEAEQAKAIAFFAVGVENANMSILSQISVREPLKLQGLRFQDLFLWLSGSMSRVSSSRPGDEIPLDNPTTPGGWASV